MSKKKIREKREKAFNYSLLIIPILISLLSLYYTYTVDRKNSKEFIQINIATENRHPTINMLLSDTVGRIDFRLNKFVKINLINNSSNKVIINKIDLDMNHLDIKVHDSMFFYIDSYREFGSYYIKEGRKYIHKKAPFIIESMDYKEVYMTSNLNISTVIKDTVNNRINVNRSLSYPKLLQYLKENENFSSLHNILTKDLDKIPKMKFSILTSKDNKFTKNIDFFEHTYDSYNFYEYFYDK